jgi:hypothetical protein
VKTFLQRHSKFYVSADRHKAGCALTHTFLDGWNGGRLCVAPSSMADFLEQLARDVALDGADPLPVPRTPPLSELRSPVCCLFIDFDIATSAADAAVSVDVVAAVATRQAARFMPGVAIHSLVLTARDKAMPDGRHKQGVHMHFPQVFVTTHEALVMREAIIVALEANAALAHVDWPNAFDNNPFVAETGGIRMVGAPKARTCPDCKNKPQPRKTCYKTPEGGCDCTGHVYENRCYGFHSCLLADGTPAEHQTAVFRANAAQLVRACSIRTERVDISPEWEAFAGCPSYSKLKTFPKRPPGAGKRVRTFAEETDSLRKWPKVPMADEAKRQRLEKIFRSRFGAVYSAVTIGSVKTGSGRMFCEFKGEGESWCPNVGRSHNSNRVYGVVEKSKAYIRCHCSCSTLEGRLSGKMCKDFCSEQKYLTPKDTEIIWAGADVNATLKKGGSGLMLESPESYLARLARELE